MSEITTIEIGVPGPPGEGITSQEKSEITSDISDLQGLASFQAGEILAAQGDIDDLETAVDKLKTDRYQMLISGGGSTISTGVAGAFTFAADATINEWTLLGDQSGSISLELWLDNYTNYPPTNADIISGSTGSQNPRIVSTNKARSSDLTGWTPAVSEAGIVLVNVVSVTNLTWCLVVLRAVRALS